MRSLRRLLVVSAAGLLVGCSPHVRPVVLPPPAPLPVDTFKTAPVESLGTPVPIVPDPNAELISAAEKEFAAGQTDLQSNKLVSARDHFDRAIDTLLNAPGGARRSPQVSAEFDQLLDRISALDVIALREGDGFTEAKSEPAVIDSLLTEAVFDHPEPELTTEEAVADDLAHTAHDVDIPVNDKVVSYVELFQGNLHQFMQDGLSRGAQYLPMIQNVFKSEGLPLDLAYVPLVESAFKPTALSRASAKGMWQFVSDTAQEAGLAQNWFLDERSDPEKATRAAAQYLKSLAEMFDGDWNLALASYNAGPGRVQHAIASSKTTDYWKMTTSTRYLPRETREYVPMILAAIVIAKNPERYGFDVAAPMPVTFDTVTVPGALDLRIIAEWAGVSVDDIQRLNPELRRTTTPSTTHELKVPVGTAPTIEARLENADPSLFKKFEFHTVRRGETLASIARSNKLTSTELKTANDMKTTRVRVGQVLMIPAHTAAALPSRPTTSSRAVASAQPQTYRVKAGDTLSSIARQFEMSVTDLKRINQLSSDNIAIGDRLTVRR